MENDQLIEFVFGQSNFYSNEFSNWIRSSPRFKSFVEKYSDKVRKKITKAQKGKGEREEDVKDVLYELQVAYLLLDCDKFTELKYEEYEIENQRSPDFTATFNNSLIFNVEVKRIRECPPEVRLATWKRQIRSQVSTIPSNLAVSMNFLTNKFDNPSIFLNRLENERPNIIDYIKAVNAIHEDKGDITVGDDGLPHPVPGFNGEVEIVFSKPPQKASRTLDWYGGEFPVFITKREYLKFRDKIVECIGQLIPGMINILVINTGSITHSYFDFNEALNSLIEIINSKETSFFKQNGFSDGDDFLAQAGNLSGVLFRSAWVPFQGKRFDKFDTCCLNPDSIKEAILPCEIVQILKSINKIQIK